MTNYLKSKMLYDELRKGATEQNTPEANDLYEVFIFQALRYANTLTVWPQMDSEERANYREKKEDEYKEYTSAFQKLCQKLKMNNIDQFLVDREAKEDFPCYVALFIALSHRDVRD